MTEGSYNIIRVLLLKAIREATKDIIERGYDQNNLRRLEKAETELILLKEQSKRESNWGSDWVDDGC